MFGTLKLISYLSCLVAGYFAYTNAISWWWVLASIALTAAFKFLATPSKTTPLTFGQSNDDEDKEDGPSEFDLDNAREIVMKFGQTMMRVNYADKIHDSNELPSDKEKILEALTTLYRDSSEDEKRERLKLAMMALCRFRKDVGDEPIEIALDPAMHAATEAEYAKNCLELEG